MDNIVSMNYLSDINFYIFLVPIKGVEGMKIPIQLQNQNIQIQHPYHHQNSQTGNFGIFTAFARDFN